jgi:hypothetical protein
MIPWARGNRADRQVKAGVQVIGEAPTFGVDQACMYVPLLAATDMKGSTTDIEFKANKRLILKSSVTIAPQKNYRVLVDVNPILLKYADIRVPRIIESGEESTLEVYITLKANFDPTELDHLLRLYLLA